jgi:glucokinase
MSDIGIVFDIGGTNTRIARVQNNALSEVHIFGTVSTPEDGLAFMISEIQKVAGPDRITGLSGDMAGIVEGGVIHVSPNLPAWNGVNVSTRLGEALGAPVSLMNDAELTALGEYHYGAGKGDRNMAYVTVSTGVGGALVKNGSVMRGTFNSEIGHQILADGMELEELISGRAVERKYGVHPKDLEDGAIRSALANMLALGLYNTALHWSPDVFVLGGSMIIGKNPIPLDHVQAELECRMRTYFSRAPKVVMAKLGSEAGLYGGMADLSHAT